MFWHSMHRWSKSYFVNKMPGVNSLSTRPTTCAKHNLNYYNRERWWVNQLCVIEGCFCGVLTTWKMAPLVGNNMQVQYFSDLLPMFDPIFTALTAYDFTANYKSPVKECYSETPGICSKKTLCWYFWLWGGKLLLLFSATSQLWHSCHTELCYFL